MSTECFFSVLTHFHADVKEGRGRAGYTWFKEERLLQQKYPQREDTHFFLVVGPLRFYPPYTNGIVVHATFFLYFFDNYFFLSNF